MQASIQGSVIGKFLFFLIFLLLAGSLYFHSEIASLHHGLTLFDKDKIVQNMRNSNEHFPSSDMPKSTRPEPLPLGETMALPSHFDYHGERLNSQDYIDYTHTGGLMVLQGGKVRFEQYYQGETATDRHISFSVAKSFISALFGIAVSQGKIDIEQNAEVYAPELKGSGYEGVRIKDILQMSSGVAFNEDYADLNSDINRFGRILSLGGSFNKFAASLQREVEPGTRRLYVSIDTQVLGIILTHATGKTISEYMSEKLWQPLGATSDAYWITDSEGMEMALGGLNASLRDFSRFGQLYLNQGQHKGQQIVPAQWWKDSLTPDAPHLMAKEDERSLDNWGYGYQWWLPPASEKHPGVFMAVGIYDQYIYIDQARDLVITKLSGNPYYTKDNYDSVPKTLALFRAMAESLD